MEQAPLSDKQALRKQLLAQRLALPNRLAASEQLQRVMRLWLLRRNDVTIGAYWPIKGEFDPLPALHRWKEDGELLDEPQRRRIGLPVVDKQNGTLTFHAWYPGCPMEEDAYGIPKPKDTEIVVPTLLFVPCVGYGPGGYRLGYGGGFYDRTLAALEPHPTLAAIGRTVNLAAAEGKQGVVIGEVRRDYQLLDSVFLWQQFRQGRLRHRRLCAAGGDHIEAAGAPAKQQAGISIGSKDARRRPAADWHERRQIDDRAVV